MSAARAIPATICLRGALCGLLLALCASGVAVAAPAISADEIVEIAASGVGSPYVWGGGCWDPNDRGWKGADCSGFVAKALQVPTLSPTTECKHPYVSGDFAASGPHWNKIDRGSMRKADVFGKDGHVILFAGGDGWGASEVYEARGSAYGIVHRTATIGAEYKAVRRTDLVDPPDPTPDPTPPPSAASGLVAQLAGASVVGGLAGDGGVVAACPGQRLQLRVELQNSGTATWRDVDGTSAGEAVRLGHRQGETLGAPPRMSLNQTEQATVAPGQRATFALSVTMPASPGTYESAWQLVSELVAWFGPLTTFVIDVTDTPADAGQPCTLDASTVSGSCTTGTLQCGAEGLTCVASAACGAKPGGASPAPGPGGPGIVPDGPASGSAIGSCALTGTPDAQLPLLLLLVGLARARRRR